MYKQLSVTKAPGLNQSLVNHHNTLRKRVVYCITSFSFAYLAYIYSTVYFPGLMRFKLGTMYVKYLVNLFLQKYKVRILRDDTI